MWLLKLIPGVSYILEWIGNTGIKLYSAKLQADGAHENKVTELALREIQLDETEARLNKESKTEIRGRWYAPENLMFYFVAFPYWFIAITVDYVLAPLFEWEHITLPLKGDTAKAMMMIMAFWFGQRAITSVASVIAGAFGKK